MATPSWIGASPKQPQLAAQVNQFLGSHAVTYLYTGVSVSSQGTAGSGGVNSNGTWNGQQFTTGGSPTTIGRARLFLGYTGSPPPMTLALYATSGSFPTGSALASTVVPSSYLTAVGATVSIPLPLSLSATSTYWLIIPAVGDVSNFYSWSKSNQASGAVTSSNGTSWTGQAYGLLYNALDQSVVPPLVHTYEDIGVRWTTYNTNAAAQPTSLQEYTVAQAANDFVYSSRTFAYSGNQFVSVT